MSQEYTNSRRTEDEWLWGWDPTPGIVSVWAEADGRAVVWRRMALTDELLREEARFRPWLVLDRLDDLRHLGGQLGREGTAGALVSYRELDGPGSLRYLVSAGDGRTLAAAVLEGAAQRLGRRVVNLRDLGKDALLALPPEEQYLVATGRTYFRGLSFDQLHRMQFDLGRRRSTSTPVRPGARCRTKPCSPAAARPGVPATASGSIARGPDRVV